MNDIWHLPSEAPAYCFQCVFYDTASNEYHFGQYSPVFKHFRSGNAGWEHEEVQKFAFAKDIIACLDELDRTRKALEIAVDALKEQQRWFGVIRVSLISHLNNQYGTLFKSYDADPTVVNIKRANDILNRALEQITALTKGGDK